MAYREVAMWEILDVLRRIGRGESKSAVSRATGHGRKTVGRYVAVATGLGWKPGEQDPTEDLASQVFRRLRPASVDRSPGEAEAQLLPHQDKIREWLEPEPGQRRGLRLTKIHQLLARQGVHVPYSSLHRFAVKHCGFGTRRVTVRVAEVAPGEVAQADFGRLGLVRDPESDRRRLARALVVTLPYSRHQYVHIAVSQTLPEVIGGLEDAWAFFGGVSRRLIIDGLKAAVTKADRYDPTFQRTFEEYARYRGFVIDATRPYHATGKPHVERNVPYVRDNFFRGEDWRDLDHLGQQAVVWCLHTAGTRIHGTTRKRPLAVFENEERDKLLPLTRERFDPPRWAQCKIHPDHHISFGKAIYSAPTRFVGKTVWVRADSKLVRLYANGSLIKTHATQPPGGRSTDYNDYPPERTAYAMRDPQRLIRQARQHGVQLARFMEALLSGDFPWAKLRQAQKLLRLGEKYGWPRLELACDRALAFELFNVHRVEAILRQDLQGPPAPSHDPAVILLPLRFGRAPESFSHHAQHQETKS